MFTKCWYDIIRPHKNLTMTFWIMFYKWQRWDSELNKGAESATKSQDSTHSKPRILCMTTCCFQQEQNCPVGQRMAPPSLGGKVHETDRKESPLPLESNKALPRMGCCPREDSEQPPLASILCSSWETRGMSRKESRSQEPGFWRTVIFKGNEEVKVCNSAYFPPAGW